MWIYNSSLCIFVYRYYFRVHPDPNVCSFMINHMHHNWCYVVGRKRRQTTTTDSGTRQELSCILHQRLRTELLAVIVHEMVAISVAPQAKKIKNVHCQRLKLTPRGSQRYSRHHSDVLSTISGALAWRGRPCVGALAGGSLTPLDPSHHTGGLWL